MLSPRGDELLVTSACMTTSLGHALRRFGHGDRPSADVRTGVLGNTT